MRIKASTEVTLVVNAKGYSERHEEAAAALEEYVKGEDFLRDVVMPRLAEHVLIERVMDSADYAEQVTMEVKPELQVPQPITPAPTSEELVALLPQEVLDICEELGFEVIGSYYFDEDDFTRFGILGEEITYDFIHKESRRQIANDDDVPKIWFDLEGHELRKLSVDGFVKLFNDKVSNAATTFDAILNGLFVAPTHPKTPDDMDDLIDACNAAKIYYSDVQELIKRVRALDE